MLAAIRQCPMQQSLWPWRPWREAVEALRASVSREVVNLLEKFQQGVVRLMRSNDILTRMSCPQRYLRTNLAADWV
jgi:hypothetical protein